MNVLFVMPDGAVYSGRLEVSVGEIVMLRSRGGRLLSPPDVAALLIPAQPLTAEERDLLHRAADTGYQLERP